MSNSSREIEIELEIALILTDQDPHLIDTFSHRGSSVFARLNRSTMRSHTCTWIENSYQVD